MSSSDFLEKLLDGVDVEWRALGELTLPTRNIKWREAERTYRYIDLTSVNIDTKSIIETSEVQASNAPSRAQKLVENGDVIFATTRPAQQRYCLIDDEYSGEVASTGYCALSAVRFYRNGFFIGLHPVTSKHTLKNIKVALPIRQFRMQR